VQQVERKIFGYTNDFTIDTKYSDRKPEEILPPELIDDRAQTNRRLLTIDDALRLAVTNSRRFQSAKEILYLAALDLTGSRYEFSPQFFATLGGFLQRDADGDLSARGAADVGVAQLLKSGGTLGVTLASDILRAYTGDPRRSLISVVSVRLTQPLLRGFGRNNPAVENLTQAERDVVYAVRDFSFFQDDFAVEVVRDYFRLLGDKDEVRNLYTNYLSRVQSTQRLEARAQDRERLSDVDQARQAELTAKNRYINAVATYNTTLDRFKITLGLPISERVNLDDSALVELKQAGLVPVPLGSDEAYRLAVRKQLQVLNAIDQFEDRKRKVRVAAHQLRPEVNFVHDVSLDSDDPGDYGTNFDPNRIRTSTGLTVDLPFNRLRERNAYRRALVDFEEELRNLTLRLDELRQAIDLGLGNMEQRRQNYEIQQNALALANRRVESSMLLLQAGRAEIRDLVEAQDAQINAQNAVTEALISYQETRLQLMLAIGALNSNLDQFWLKDHLEGYVPEGVRVVRRPPPADAPVPTPEDALNN
jgi:outer membrane protein TolC